MRVCKNGKIRHRDQLAAKIAMSRVSTAKSRMSAGKMERREYYCKMCRGWHLTSQPDMRHRNLIQ